MIFSRWCRERDSNPHNHYWSRDFKSLVSTNSTIAASQQFLKSSAKIRLICVTAKTFTLFNIKKYLKRLIPRLDDCIVNG